MRAPGEAQGGGRGVSMTDAGEQPNAVTPRPRVAFGLLNVLLERLGGLLGTEDEREAIREALGVLDELIKAVNEGDLSAFPSRTAQALANARWALNAGYVPETRVKAHIILLRWEEFWNAP